MRGLRAWGQVSQNVLEDPSIGMSAKALYALLCAHAKGSDDGICYPDNKELAGALGCTDRTVKTLLRELLDAGVIVREEQHDKGRQINSVTRLIDGSTSQRGEVDFPPGEEALFPPRGEADFPPNTKKKIETEKNASRSPRTRRQASHPWPEGWEPDHALREWTFTNCPHIDAVAEWQQFHDWALSGDVRKVDWTATWRNWARRAEKQTTERRPAKKQGGSNWDRMKMPT